MIRNVVVGVSGGVDSAVTAYFLKNKGRNENFIFLYFIDMLLEMFFSLRI